MTSLASISVDTSAGRSEDDERHAAGQAGSGILALSVTAQPGIRLERGDIEQTRAKLSFLALIPIPIYKVAMAQKFVRFLHWRIWAAAAAMLVSLAAMTCPAAAQEAVTCTYTVTNSWNGGFTANVDITNNGPAINGWTLRWTFTTPTADVQGWAAVITEQNGNRATAANMSWNGSIPTGQAISFGWTAAAVSTGVPADLTINGETC